MKGFLSLLALPLLTHAWWDEGHALGTTIAKLSMDQDNMNKLEKILELFDKWYPGLGNLHFSSVWADQVKCSNSGPSYCGLHRADNLRLFYEWHWSSNNHIPNADHVDLEGKIESFNPLPGKNAVWATEKMTQDLKFSQTSASDVKDDQGTFVPTVMSLMLINHFYTDLHMPCHATETFAVPHLTGDQGCNFWVLDTADSCAGKTDSVKGTNLHAFWDSMGGESTTSWPTLTWANLETKAKAIIEDYPKTHDDIKDRITGQLSGLNVSAISLDSMDFAQKNVFEDFTFTGAATVCPYPEGSDCATGCKDPCTKNYCMSADYVKNVQEKSRKQVALSGYRLAVFLDDLVPYLKDADVLSQVIGGGTGGAASVSLFGAALVVAAGLVGA